MIDIQKVHIKEIDYAIRGNAILGIKDSGKTFSATYFAERLMDAQIPIIAFDPIGIWRWLQVGKGKKKGYPVVVAGDGGDLPLTTENASAIVRAAMEENISLVLDLYSMNLSKAAWRNIVEQSVNLLLNENKSYGVRHVFLEEASEFVPQRVRPEQGRVYAEIEKLVRMGGNASLGVTLINQRSEEVNKAVLELCDCLILHRQKGRHSITNLGKWLDVASIENADDIKNSLPTLGKGECWIWDEGSTRPVLVQIPEKNTVHPDRRNPEVSRAAISVDVSVFVERMRKSLSSQKQVVIKAIDRGKKKKEVIDPGYVTAGRETELLDEIASLRGQLSQVNGRYVDIQSRLVDAQSRLEKVRQTLLPQYEGLKNLFEEIGSRDSQIVSGGDLGHWQIWLDKFSGKKKRILEVMIERRSLTLHQLRVLVGVSNSGSFRTYVSSLVALGLVKKEGGNLVVQDII